MKLKVDPWNVYDSYIHRNPLASETVSQGIGTVLSSRTNVRDLRFLPEFTVSLAEGVEMTERLAEAMFSILRYSLSSERK
jgi:hypothetical protein